MEQARGRSASGLCPGWGSRNAESRMPYAQCDSCSVTHSELGPAEHGPVPGPVVWIGRIAGLEIQVTAVVRDTAVDPGMGPLGRCSAYTRFRS